MLTEEISEVFDLSMCDKCGDFFVKCQYVDYEREEAIKEINLELISKCNYKLYIVDYGSQDKDDGLQNITGGLIGQSKGGRI